MGIGLRTAARRALRAIRGRASAPGSELNHDSAYQARLHAEENTYRNCVNVHALPEIFHYWSDRYVRPKLEAFGFSSPDDMFRKFLREQCEKHPDRANEFVSIGSGNCDLEVDLAQSLRGKGWTNFTIECIDLNKDMLSRGKTLAEERGVSQHLRFSAQDFNRWQPNSRYDAVLVNQALHHVLNLEGLYDAIHSSLKEDGLFITSDMIGRNGHLRWPEALAIVQEYWSQLPKDYRYNQQLKRQEDMFQDWDCSQSGFEGIRAQDVLPLLLPRFHFELFVVFGNVIDPFVDRSFGHNFHADADWDKQFIDRVHERDEQEMLAGRIKPTHMLAVMSKNPKAQLRFHAPFTPQFAVRPAEAAAAHR
jgi:2-polyprenyl-3-methyl-5-hydroxy-6-metoxy-1,4-benzoquinol methylase